MPCARESPSEVCADIECHVIFFNKVGRRICFVAISSFNVFVQYQNYQATVFGVIARSAVANAISNVKLAGAMTICARVRTRMCERFGLRRNLVWRACAFARIGRNVIVSCRLHAKMLPLACVAP